MQIFDLEIKYPIIRLRIALECWCPCQTEDHNVSVNGRVTDNARVFTNLALTIIMS